MPIRPPHPQNVAFTLPTVKMVVDTSKSEIILSNHNIIKILRSKVISILHIVLSTNYI